MNAAKFFRWTAAIVLALLLGSLFSYFGLAAAWILAGILTSATVAMTTHHELPLHRLIDKSARGVIGVLAGIPMAVVTLDELTAVALPGLIVSLLTIAIGFGFGPLLAKREPSISCPVSLKYGKVERWRARVMLPTLQRDGTRLTIMNRK
ncbi:hypothetical protein [Corynebacterium phoceense]|uniref:hypothetical protein n=1 Tax=Corynebacterium phoceense TaxID=1686286 RepID=UPI001DA884FE|nr:hypothetical protein [Corynebacterium phoceense]HJG42632.1 hypothetical protein [Corynebacterium phoceense]